MNKERRKRIAEIAVKLEALAEDIAGILEEEEGYRDGMPEGLQGSDRYDRACDACDNLDFARDELCEVVVYLQDAMGGCGK